MILGMAGVMNGGWAEELGKEKAPEVKKGAEPDSCSSDPRFLDLGKGTDRLAFNRVRTAEGRKDHTVREAVLVDCKYDVETGTGQKPSYTVLLGMNGRYSPEEMTAGLRAFYRTWKPPADNPQAEPPNIVLVIEAWGAFEMQPPADALAREYGLDLWFASRWNLPKRAEYPLPSDRRLGEILKKQREEKKGK